MNLIINNIGNLNEFARYNVLTSILRIVQFGPQLNWWRWCAIRCQRHLICDIKTKTGKRSRYSWSTDLIYFKIQLYHIILQCTLSWLSSTSFLDVLYPTPNTTE